ncbi:MAG TPA: flagellar basal-body MS-ring/collar protein FliF [Cellvibrionaceae bacterium]
MAASETAAGSEPRSGNYLIQGFNNLNLLRQAGLMVGLAASVAIGFAVVLWTQGEDYRPLYGSLEHLDSKEVTEILDSNEIRFKIDENSGALLVGAKDVHKARLKLAEAGISNNNNTAGFELLDKEQPLGTSQFMEGARYRRSLEGELARTIASVTSVKSARVHLAIPKASVFVRDNHVPSASVFLELFPGRGIDPNQVRGIANLIASSVSELKPENVTVVDQKGSLLSLGVEDTKLTAASQHLDYTHKVETDLVLRVRRLLSPIIGDDNFKTEVSADLDFSEIEQAQESFNPDLPALRSEQTSEEVKKGPGADGGIPGALTNQPAASASAPEVAKAPADAKATTATEQSNSRTQATRNFELDRTVSFTKHEKGKLKRISLAVVVNDKLVTDPATGQKAKMRWSEAELERLAALVRDAVGYSAARGDSVNVMNEAFLDPDGTETFAQPWWQADWFKSIGKQGAGIFIILVLIVGLLRPVLKSLASSGLQSRAEEEAKELEALRAAGVDGFDSLSDETVTLTGGDSLALPSPEQSYEQQLNAVKALVAEDPGRVAQVIKRWINENE